VKRIYNKENKQDKCYFCDKPAEYIVRIIESPKDGGIKVGVCKKHYLELQEK